MRTQVHSKGHSPHMSAFTSEVAHESRYAYRLHVLHISRFYCHWNLHVYDVIVTRITQHSTYRLMNSFRCRTWYRVTVKDIEESCGTCRTHEQLYVYILCHHKTVLLLCTPILTCGTNIFCGYFRHRQIRIHTHSQCSILFTGYRTQYSCQP